MAPGKVLAALPVLIALLGGCSPLLMSELMSGWTVAARASWTLKDMPNLEGKTALVTGASTGIGRVTAFELGKAGAKVFIHGRKLQQMEMLKDEIEAAGGEAEILLADFTDLASIGKMATGMARSLHGTSIDIVVLNAGYCKDCSSIFGNAGFELTKDGFEKHIQINHLAHQLLMEWLLALGYLNPQTCRVVTVSSAAHEFSSKKGVSPEGWTSRPDGYTDFGVYAESKLANILMAHELNRRYGFSSVSLHPGLILDTAIWEEADFESIYGRLTHLMLTMGSMTVQQGALNQLWAAVQKKPKRGYYLPVGKLSKVRHTSFGDAAAEALWDRTNQALEQFLPPH
mmetsp:Transcript_41628/g.89365  ORF Transcript_41628/g.89365 Transcript_41628/m.89365 type:complete len:343 (+) Transcript_41628:39-1067(+)